MIVDFHTHTFPDQIAGRAIEKLSQSSKLKPYTNGTVHELIESMEKSGTDLSVILPVVTNPSQFDTINQTAKRINETYPNRLISFGGIHPDCDNIESKLREIKQMGLIGIKLHPDYQNTFIDDPRYLRIIERASELGLIIVVHAGVDIGFPNPVHCTPKATKHMIDQIHPKRLVLAHMGGCDMWDQVEEYLVGENVYMDTAFVYYGMKSEQFRSIVRKHGADKILYATDSPWCSQIDSIDWIRKSGLGIEEQHHIFYKNACTLLSIQE